MCLKEPPRQPFPSQAPQGGQWLGSAGFGDSGRKAKLTLRLSCKLLKKCIMEAVTTKGFDQIINPMDGLDL